MAEREPPIVIPWQRLLIHLLFLALTIYVMREVFYRLFADSWIVEHGSARRPAVWIPIVLATAAAHRLFDRLYPIAEQLPEDR